MSDSELEAVQSDFPRVMLVGAGVVGREIAEAHLGRGVEICLADVDAAAIDRAVSEYGAAGFDAGRVSLPLEGLAAAVIRPPETDVSKDETLQDQGPMIVVESVVERLETKQSLFCRLQRWVGEEAVLCTNTSTLQIDQIAGDAMDHPGRICGLHFFMPVHARAAVEVIRGPRTDEDAIDVVINHAKRIGKKPICCSDGPGFVVNRMLSPYLNQALLLLCRGATADQLERAAIAYGMPFSPLELIDWIGAPTMYHAGRAFQNAFPHRINASPVVPALVKRKRFGRASNAGLFDYVDGQRSRDLAPEAQKIVETYAVDGQGYTDGDVLLLLSIPMWIEATHLLRDSIADSMETVDLAMAGGLGYSAHSAWSDFFGDLGAEGMGRACDRWQDTFRSMKP